MFPVANMLSVANMPPTASVLISHQNPNLGQFEKKKLFLDENQFWPQNDLEMTSDLRFDLIRLTIFRGARPFLFYKTFWLGAPFGQKRARE